jgi:hypothetical protein
MFTCLVADVSPPGALEALARSCSPRVEPHGSNAVIIDTSGLARVVGPPDVVAREIVHLASAQGLTIRLATAGTRTAAWLLAHARAGITLVPNGKEASALAGLAVGWLGALVGLDPLAPGLSSAKAAEAYRERFAIFERWGLRTLGDIAALRRADLDARMGPPGVRLHQAASGEDAVPLVPAAAVLPFVDRLALEWPIEGLEPLSFVLARQCDQLSARLARADRGAVAITTRLRLVTKDTHARTLHLPAPLTDPRVWRTLILLDLESHPPAAAIDVVEIELDVTPGPILQGSLLAQTLPSNEDVTTLVARLGALVGETRVGTPRLVDTYDARVIATGPFHVRPELRRGHGTSDIGNRTSDIGYRASDIEHQAPMADGRWPMADAPRLALRRFRIPMAVRVTVVRGVPVRIASAGHGFEGGAVVASAGPWRTSGAWWMLDRSAWDRDEWDVALASGGIYRLARQRATGIWEIEGLFD